MRRTVSLVLVVFTCALSVACTGETPTGPSASDPIQPSLNASAGGGWLGGGGRSEPTSTSTADGGGWLGGGGKVAPSDSTATQQ